MSNHDNHEPRADDEMLALVTQASTQLTFASQAELGQHLIERALGNVQARFHAVVVSYVEDLMNKMRTSRATLLACEANLRHYDAQLKAVRAGEFTIDSITGRILFTDARLNQ